MDVRKVLLDPKIIPTYLSFFIVMNLYYVTLTKSMINDKFLV